jgi:hypothetical protein
MAESGPKDGAPTFELGLVLAGAISAGAYAAGVIDFLIEALDAWYPTRAPGGPCHDFKLRVVTGASAGAMTAAIAAASLGKDTVPVRDVDNPPEGVRNRLFDAWVRRVDIKDMLALSDLDSAPKVVSLLNSLTLKTIADDALDAGPALKQRFWLDDPIAVYLTIVSLRGIPYEFHFAGPRGSTWYQMLCHADRLKFSLGRGGKRLEDAFALDPAKPGDTNWKALANGALASGAFPVGLQPRFVNRPFADYAELFPPYAPSFPPRDAAEEKAGYTTLCVDGGLMNNEPLELARRYLADDGCNPRRGTEAHRAVIMVDPFPNVISFPLDYPPEDRLIKVVPTILSALINQARFKEDELRLAEDPNTYSRFLISPSRDRNNEWIEPAMASAILGGFGGFLAEDNRKHDFQLGRRNCQRFLQNHFCLPETNPLFRFWTDPASRAQHYAKAVDGTPDVYTEPVNGEDRAVLDKDGRPVRMLPIVPLVGATREEVPLRAPPSAASVDLDRLGKMLDARIAAVGRTLIDHGAAEIFGNALVRTAAKKYLDWQIAPALRKKAIAKIAAELARLR